MLAAGTDRALIGDAAAHELTLRDLLLAAARPDGGRP
jgi:hypothetical protein